MDSYRKELALAIRSGYFLRNLELDPKDASDIADYLLSFFGYEEEIIDNMLMGYDRDVFYQMEDIGVLKTSQYSERIKEGNYAGREWTLNKWVLDKSAVHNLIEKAYEKSIRGEDPGIVYENLFSSASVDDLKNPDSNNPPKLESAFSNLSSEGHSAMKMDLENYMKSKKASYLSIFTTLLSPDVKPLAYLAMEPDKDYTVSGALKAMADRFGFRPEELENHINFRSIMESLVSIGALHEKKIEAHNKEASVYSKSQQCRAFDLVAAHAVKVSRRELEQAGFMLSDVFSASVSQTVIGTHSQNLFGLMKLLAENKGKSFTLHEIKKIIDSDSVRSEVRLFNSLGLLDYESFPGKGKDKKKLYRVLSKTNLEELQKRGFVKKPDKCFRLVKVIKLINENVDKDIDRFDVSSASGADIDFSSKYLVMFSKAGVLQRKADWSKKRSTVKANENTAKVWDGLLSWLYNAAIKASSSYSIEGKPLDRLEAALHSYEAYLRELQDYARSKELIEDCSAHLRYLSKNRHRIVKSSEVEGTILDAAKDGVKMYEIVETLWKNTGTRITYAGTQWHVNELLRKGLLEKEESIYTAKGTKRMDKRQ